MGVVIDGFTWVLRILFAVRVSVINAASSIVLFWFAAQAQDLLADLSFQGFQQYGFWFLVFAATFLLWAFPVHYGARRTLDEDFWIIQRATRDGLGAHCRDEIIASVRVRYGWAIKWLPRVLGLMPFVALAIGIWGALGAIGGAQALPETGRAQFQLEMLFVLDGVAAIAFLTFVIKRKDWFPDWTGDVLHPVALLGTGAIFVFAYVLPVWTAIHMPRALLVPPLFGSLVLFTSWLQRLGNRMGFPFLVALAFVAGVLTSLNTNFDALRTLPDKVGAPASPDERLTMHEAALRWRKANGCEMGPCPRPIIVAIDGGASRAAFTAATFVGEVLDRIEPAKRDEAPTPGRRIFAISGVSGGAYGAAVIQAALRDGQSERGRAAPPCRSARSTWFGYDDWHDGGNVFSWRQCLQALTSGDYLSPTIIGLAFRDFAAPPWQRLGLPAMADRAGLLEMTWEQQYSATLKAGQTPFLDGDHCNPDAPAGLCRPAAHPASFVDDQGKAWMPMLFLNGTSVATGRRMVSADIRSQVVAKQPVFGGALYPEAFDLREAMASQCTSVPALTENGGAYAIRYLAQKAAEGRNERTLLLGSCGAGQKLDGPDVRLSTAALTSARFPVISPAGILTMNASPYGDQVVDGGYFENAGITTALDITRGLAIEGLTPLLVSIANDPQVDALSATDLVQCTKREGASPRESLSACAGMPPRAPPTPLVFTSDNTFFQRFIGLVSRPLQTIMGTRDGHADEAMAQAELAFADGGFFRFKVQVAPIFDPHSTLPLADDKRCQSMTPGTKLDMAKVSMSWWLSASVQADLDVQRCSVYNRNQLDALLVAMAKRDGAAKL